MLSRIRNWFTKIYEIIVMSGIIKINYEINILS